MHVDSNFSHQAVRVSMRLDFKLYSTSLDKRYEQTTCLHDSTALKRIKCRLESGRLISIKASNAIKFDALDWVPETEAELSSLKNDLSLTILVSLLAPAAGV